MRYLRVLSLFWRNALAAEMEYRLHFAVAALTSAGALAGSLFTLSLFYSAGSGLPGWTWPEALIVMGMFTLLDGVSASCLAPNLNRIVGHVQQGTLDFVLLKPIDSQFWLSTRNFTPWGLPSLVLGGAMIVLAASRLDPLPSPIRWLAGLAMLAVSLVVLYSLWFILAATSVWFVKIYNATEVLRNLLEAGRYPTTAYPLPYRIAFTFVIPVTFLTTVPAQTVLGRATLIWLLAAAGLAVGLLAVARLWWRFALRYYTSASS